MERVGRAEEGGGREFAEALRGSAEQGVIHRVPLPKAAGAIGLELVSEQVKAVHIDDALAQLPVKDGDEGRADYPLAIRDRARGGRLAT